MTTNTLRLLTAAFGAAALLTLAACGAEPEPTAAKVVAPPPAKVCDKAREGIATLVKSGAVVLDGPGAVTISEQVWLGMGAAGQDQFGQLLAFNAACAAGQPAAEQQIMVRGDSGMVLSNRIVETSPDTAALFVD